MSRKRFEWKIRDKVLQLGERTLIMGVLNVTPDSFSDGGKYEDPDRAFARAMELEEQGADMIDIGAESTRPGSARISEAEELRRLVPVLKRLRGKLTIPLSVDTYKAGVAEKALELGADIINDPSALTFDPELARKVAAANAGLILNHMRGTPDTWTKLPPLKNAIATIAQELEAAVHRAVRSGVDRKQIVIDPGLGFGKRREQNAEIIAHLAGLARLSLPILAGPSRKHFLAKESADSTEFATAAAVAACVIHGAHIVRIHDVQAMRAVVQVADEIAANVEAPAAVLPRQTRPPEPKESEAPAMRVPKPAAPPKYPERRPFRDEPEERPQPMDRSRPEDRRPPGTERRDRPFRPQREDRDQRPERGPREFRGPRRDDQRPKRFGNAGPRGPKRSDDGERGGRGREEGAAPPRRGPGFRPGSGRPNGPPAGPANRPPGRPPRPGGRPPSDRPGGKPQGPRGSGPRGPRPPGRRRDDDDGRGRR